MTMTSLEIAASPRALSPVERSDTLKTDTLSIPSAGRRESHDSGGTSRSTSVGMDISGPPTDSEAEAETEEADGSRSLPPVRARTGPPGDDAGPRFGVEDASKDSRAKPGEAGHSGIYNGENVSDIPSPLLHIVFTRRERS